MPVVLVVTIEATWAMSGRVREVPPPMTIHCPSVNSVLSATDMVVELAAVVPVVKPKSTTPTLTGIVVLVGMIGMLFAHTVTPAAVPTVDVMRVSATPIVVEGVCAAAIVSVDVVIGMASTATNDGLEKNDCTRPGAKASLLNG